MPVAEIISIVLGLASLGFFVLQFQRAFFPENPRPGEGWFGPLDVSLALLVSAFLGILAWGIFHAPEFEITEKELQAGLISQLMMGGIVLGYIGLRRIPLKDFMGFGRGPLWRQTGLAVFLLAGFFPLIAVIANHLDNEPTDEQQVVQFFRGTDSVQGRWLVAFLAVVVAPVVEELVFRGWIYRAFRGYFGKIAAMIFASVLFAAIHGNVAMALPLTLLAFGLTIGLELSGSLWVSMVMHAMFNATSLIFMLLHKPQ